MALSPWDTELLSNSSEKEREQGKDFVPLDMAVSSPEITLVHTSRSMPLLCRHLHTQNGLGCSRPPPLALSVWRMLWSWAESQLSEVRGWSLSSAASLRTVRPESAGRSATLSSQCGPAGGALFSHAPVTLVLLSCLVSVITHAVPGKRKARPLRRRTRRSSGSSWPDV